MFLPFDVILMIAITLVYIRCRDYYFGVYDRLACASTPKKMERAFWRLEKIKGYAGAAPKNVTRKAFQASIDLRDKAFEQGTDGDCFELFQNWLTYLSHLAAISGDVELLRKMSATNYGSAAAKLKGMWVEEFLRYNPDLFFSLPDNWDLCKRAGGTAWCCDNAKVTVPIVKQFAPNTDNGQRILDDLKNTVFVVEKDTEWAKEAQRVLSDE